MPVGGRWLVPERTNGSIPVQERSVCLRYRAELVVSGDCSERERKEKNHAESTDRLVPGRGRRRGSRGAGNTADDARTGDDGRAGRHDADGGVPTGRLERPGPTPCVRIRVRTGRSGRDAGKGR